jgi:hypothetical protein
MSCWRGAKCGPSICSDNTTIRSCSPDKPKYCFYGQLIERCFKCGCPTGLDCLPDGRCINSTMYATIT